MTQAVVHSSTESDLYELWLQLGIKSVQSEVSFVVEHVAHWMAYHMLDDEIVGELQLVLAEALNNVVEHAYLYSEDGVIDVFLSLDPAKLTIKITDTGRKFDGPPPFKEMDVENYSFEELPEGGFGWNLIRTLTDYVEFEHADKQNRLILTRNLRVDIPA